MEKHGVRGKIFPDIHAEKVANQEKTTNKPTHLFEPRNVSAFFPKKIDFWPVFGSKKKISQIF